MIRRAFASRLADERVVRQRPAPVAGSTRRTVPSRVTGSPSVRRSWLRSAPPSAVGGVSVAPGAPGGSPQGFSGLPSWPAVDEVEAGAVAAADVERARRRRTRARRSSGSGTAGTSPRRAPARLRSSRCRRRGRRESRPLTTQPSVVGPGGVGQSSGGCPGAPARRLPPIAGVVACRARRRTGRSGSSGRAPAEQAAVPEVVHAACCRSAKMVGVVSVRLSKTLMRPLFSATKTRPSGGEAHGGRVGQAAEDDRFLEAGRNRPCFGGLRVCKEKPDRERAKRRGFENPPPDPNGAVAG